MVKKKYNNIFFIDFGNFSICSLLHKKKYKNRKYAK